MVLRPLEWNTTSHGVKLCQVHENRAIGRWPLALSLVVFLFAFPILGLARLV